MILLTGGAGLIGSAILWQLNREGREDVVVVDHLATGEKWQNLRALKFADYFEKDEFKALMEAGKFELGKENRYFFTEIIHLGACSDTTEVDASYLAGNNFAYGKMLAEYAVRSSARMVYASSAATYGDGEQGFTDDEDGIFKLRPLNKYGYSKQIFDEWLYMRKWLKDDIPFSNASFAGVKYSNVFGPNEYHKAHMRSMLLRSFEQIQSKGSVGLFRSYRSEYGDGEQVRDFLYVKDAADMTLFVLRKGREARGLFNVGYGDVRSWNDLAKACFAAYGKEPVIEYIEMPVELRGRYQYRTCLDISKIRKLGYDKTLTSLEDAAADYCRYFKCGAHLGDLD